MPSQTELLFDLGLEKSIVGVTKFCVHPSEALKTKTIVGGTKDVKYDRIKALQPDIILCNKEENTKEIVETLSEIAPVHVSDIFDLQDALELIQQYGSIFSVEEKATVLVNEILVARDNFQASVKNKTGKKVAYFIWRKPWMVAGKNTFIDFLLKENKFENVIENKRYPVITLSDLQKIPDLDFIFLSSEPYPFQQKHIEEIQSELPSVKIILVDGEYFSWYGSRLKYAYTYFTELQLENGLK